jgi:3-dehydroquinate synthase
LAGFAAVHVARGIDFAFAPTTVLAMVDASVGGKKRRGFPRLQKLVGTFNLPRFVL